MPAYPAQGLIATGADRYHWPHWRDDHHLLQLYRSYLALRVNRSSRWRTLRSI